MRNWKRLVGLATWLLIGAGSCCSDEPKLKVRDMGGRLDYSFKWASSVSFDASMAFDFDASFNFSTWGGFSTAGRATLNFDFSGKLGFSQQLIADLDDDGVAELVKLIAVGASSNSPERVYLAWSGDAYTRDAGRCYVMWWEGSKLQLLNASCGGTEPALHCEMASGHADSLTCDVCGSSGSCAPCSAADVSSCVDEGTDKLSRGPAPSLGRGGTAGASGSGTSLAGRGIVAGFAGVISGAGVAGSTMAAGTAGMLNDLGVAGSAAFAGASGVSIVAGGAGTGDAAGSAGMGGVGAGGLSVSELGGASTTVSAAYTACLGQVQSLISMATGCNLGMLRDANELCSNQLPSVTACASAVAGAILTSSCKVLQSSACQGVF